MSALNELQNYTFVSKYARWIEKENRRETWKEAVDRVKNMMHTQYENKNITEQINWAYDIMLKKKVLGSQRALQFGGEPILKRHAKIYNCTSSYCDRLRFFQECFWLLLCGTLIFLRLMQSLILINVGAVMPLMEVLLEYEERTHISQVGGWW